MPSPSPTIKPVKAPKARNVKAWANGPGKSALNRPLSAEGAKCIKYPAPSALRNSFSHNPGRGHGLLHFAPLALVMDIRDGAVAILNRAGFGLQSIQISFGGDKTEAGPLVCDQYFFKNCPSFIPLTVGEMPTSDTVQNAMRTRSGWLF